MATSTSVFAELLLQAGSYEVSTTIADRGHVYDHAAE